MLSPVFLPPELVLGFIRSIGNPGLKRSNTEFSISMWKKIHIKYNKPVLTSFILKTYKNKMNKIRTINEKIIKLKQKPNLEKIG